jgi:hypothetical protein
MIPNDNKILSNTTIILIRKQQHEEEGKVMNIQQNQEEYLH